MRVTSLATFLLVPCLYSSAQAEIFEIDIPANNVAYSTQTGMLYATVASSAGVPFGNTLIEIDPATAAIVDGVFVGSEPQALAISPEAAVAYVGLEGAAAVRSVDLSTLTAGVQFSLGPSTGFGPLFPTRIAVMPGSPSTIAVSRHDKGVSPDYQGVGIFDSGVMRSTAITSFYGPVSLAFGSSASTLYGYDSDGTQDLYDMAIDSNGVTVASSASNYMGNADILVDNNLIYATSGAVLDTANFQLVGTYQSQGPVVVDDSVGFVMFVDQNTIQAFDRDTFLPLFSVSIENASGNPISAASCGSKCVAAVFDSHQIFVVTDVERIFADGFE